MAANIKTKGATLRAAPSLRRGTKQIRTAVAGFADLCLTARPWYRVLITSAKVLLFLEPTRVDRVFLSFALHFAPKLPFSLASKANQTLRTMHNSQKSNSSPLIGRCQVFQLQLLPTRTPILLHHLNVLNAALTADRK